MRGTISGWVAPSPCDVTSAPIPASHTCSVDGIHEAELPAKAVENGRAVAGLSRRAFPSVSLEPDPCRFPENRQAARALTGFASCAAKGTRAGGARWPFGAARFPVTGRPEWRNCGRVDVFAVGAGKIG